jgi:hypothetical protein
MKPEDFSQLLLKPGTLVGLIGDYGDDSKWSHGAMIKCILISYIVIERRHHPYPNKWDAGAIVSSNQFLETVGCEGQEYSGDRFLLIQRVPNLAWDNQDPGVYVYGIKNGEQLGEGSLLREQWEPKTVWLSAAANLSVEEPGSQSEFSIAWQARLKSKGQQNDDEE